MRLLSWWWKHATSTDLDLCATGIGTLNYRMAAEYTDFKTLSRVGSGINLFSYHKFQKSNRSSNSARSSEQQDTLMKALGSTHSIRLLLVCYF